MIDALRIAKRHLKQGKKVYVTSDNGVYPEPDLTALKKHCEANGLKLFDAATEKEIETKKLKKSE